MKKAYEWREEQIKRGLKGDILSMEMDSELIPFFKEIQRDAMQSAANICKLQNVVMSNDFSFACKQCEQEIKKLIDEV